MLVLSLPTLTGCPLSDDYYVDDSLDTGGTGGSGLTASDGGAGGSGTVNGTSATNGTGGSSNQGESGGSGGGSTGSDGGNSSVTGDTATGGSGAGGNTNEVTTTSSTTGGHICEPACSAGRACRDGACEGGWVPMAKPPPGFAPRQRAAAVAFEGKVFVFGGVDRDGKHLGTGATYDPRSNTWSNVAIDEATPSPRELASAVWTGSHVLVVGGLNDDGYLRDAALYDPDTNRWTSIDSAMTPRARGIAGVVDGAVILLQGMTTYGDTEIDAERYDLDSETWSLAGDPGDLPPLWSSAIVFAEHDVYVYGGNSNAGRTDAAYRYDVREDSWLELPDALSSRSGCFGVWDGGKFYVFGGHDTAAYSDGAVFASDAWKPIPDDGAPSPRRAPPAWSGWAFPLGADDFIVMGGVDGSDNVLVDGGRFREAVGWEQVKAWPSGEFHAEGVGVWTGEEFVLWSGEPDGDRAPTPTGERWAP